MGQRWCVIYSVWMTERQHLQHLSQVTGATLDKKIAKRLASLGCQRPMMLPHWFQIRHHWSAYRFLLPRFLCRASVSSERSHNAVATVKPLKLSKAQWLQVAQVKMTGHWSNQEEVESFKVVNPSVSDPYYFWMYWDTPAGRDGLDRCGWQVADLNKHLLSGKLTFKQVGKLGQPYSNEFVS